MLEAIKQTTGRQIPDKYRPTRGPRPPLRVETESLGNGIEDLVITRKGRQKKHFEPGFIAQEGVLRVRKYGRREHQQHDF